MYLNATEYCSAMFSFYFLDFKISVLKGVPIPNVIWMGTPLYREILKSKKFWFENPDHQKMIILLSHTKIALKDNNPHPQKSMTYTKNQELGRIACFKVIVFII